MFSDTSLLIYYNVSIAKNSLIYMNDTSEISYIKMNQRSIKLAMFSEMSTKESLWGFIQLTAWLSVISWQVKNILEIDIKTPNKNY